MSLLLRNVSLSLNEDEERLQEIVGKRIGVGASGIGSLRVVRKGVDARKKGKIKLVYTVEFTVADEARFLRRHGSDPDIVAFSPQPSRTFPRIASDGGIVIVGTGPAGLFAALRLAEYGLKATILERGKPVDERLKDVQSFWSGGPINTESNVQFGEGGAGTFSDGKLTTRVRDENISYVLDLLVRFGAPEEIAWLAKPHIGTDRLRGVVKSIRRHLLDRGFAISFSSPMTGISAREGRVTGALTAAGVTPCQSLILAPGNSARDTFEMLNSKGIALECKQFAVGFRVEHPQELINRIQYGVPSHPRLPPADYAVTYNDKSSARSAYSFCMCPGGVVVAAASEVGGVVTNGMSEYLRNSPWANSAIVATVGEADMDMADPLAGMKLQRKLEDKAYTLGGGDYRAPAQKLVSFAGGKAGAAVRSTYLPGVRQADLRELFPAPITSVLSAAVTSFDQRMRGFLAEDATIVGVETRTSSPVRIIRGSDFESVSLRGLYPAGEGAGYAGGIMSAALDGIRVADAVVRKIAEGRQA